MGKRTNNRANSSSSKKRAAGQKHSQVLINEQSTEEFISDKNVESEEIEIEEKDEPEFEEIATVAVEMEQERDETKSVQPSTHPPTSQVVAVAGPSQSPPMEQNDGWNLVRGKNSVTTRSQQDVNDEIHSTSIAGFNKEVGTPIHTNNSFVLEGHVGCLEQAPKPPFVIGVNQRPKRTPQHTFMAATNEFVRFDLKCFILLACLFLASIAKVIDNYHFDGCSIEEIEIKKCLHQGEGTFFIDPCCKALNQAIEVGFHCLCSLVASCVHLPSYPISLELTNCQISAPPLAFCHKLPAVPVMFPPMRPKELNTFRPPPATYEPDPFQWNLTSPEARNKQRTFQNSTPEINFPNERNVASSGGDKSKALSHQNFFIYISMAFHVAYVWTY
ncbi:hypothetical protein ACFE04_007523 [Oxalis oulophora]